jgi:hypothetical protein
MKTSFSSLSPAPEYVASVAIGLSAGMTSTVLTGWAQVSDLGRAIIFVGSSLSGALFTYWASRSSSMPAAFGKSTVAGALQANISASALVCLAFVIDDLLHISPGAYPGDLGSLAIIMLVAGSIVGAIVGMLYAIVPMLVARWRRTPSMANADRASFASAAFLVVATLVHASIVQTWAAWAPLALGALLLVIGATVRTKRRAAFLARVRAGLEPRYRIESAEEDERRSVLYRLAEEDDREVLYREAAPRPAEPKAVGVL